MHQRDTLYINGNWVAPSGQGNIEVNEASTEQVICSVPKGGDACDGLKKGEYFTPNVFGLAAPFGGDKQPGKGCEPGRYGLDEFHEYQSLQCRPVRSAYPASWCST